MTTPLQIALAERCGWKWYKHASEIVVFAAGAMASQWVEFTPDPDFPKADYERFCPRLDDNFLRLYRTKLLTTPALQEEFLRQLGFLLPPNPAGELGLPTVYDYVNASIEQQATALVAMFKTKE